MVRKIAITVCAMLVVQVSVVDASFFFFKGSQEPTSMPPKMERPPIRERVRPPKEAIIQEEKRRALHIIQLHEVNIEAIQDRVENIMSLLEKAGIDTQGLPQLVLKLQEQIDILQKVEDDIETRRVTKEEIGRICDNQRQVMRDIMKELRGELSNILQSIKE